MGGILDKIYSSFRKMKTSDKNESGFTLIELSVVLAVFSAIAVNAITTKNELVVAAKAEKETQIKIEKIKSYLDKFAVENGFYPCPADGTLPFENADFGVAQAGVSAGECKVKEVGAAGVNYDSGESVTNAGNNVYMGGVPVKALGLSPDAATDEWGRRIMYAVSGTDTDSSLFGTNFFSHIVILNSYDNSFALDSQEEVSKRADFASYALISYGVDGVGAFPHNGGTYRIAPKVSSSADVVADSDEQRINHKMAGKIGALQSTKIGRVFIKPSGKIAISVKFDDVIEFGDKACRPQSVLPVSDSLAVWLDAADKTTMRPIATAKSSGAVEKWIDKSCNGRDAIQVTEVKQPWFNTRTRNSKTVLDFDGANDNLKTLAFGGGLTRPNTVFLVAARDSVGVGNVTIDGLTSGGSNLNSVDSGAYSISAGTAVTGGVPTMNPEIHSMVFDGASSDFYVNSEAIFELNDVGANSLDGLTIGSAYHEDSLLNGYVGEVIIYNSNLTYADRYSVELYLATKWAILPKMTNLSVHLDSSVLTSLYQTSDCSTIAVSAGGDSVGCWKDLSGNNNHVVQAMGGIEPSYDVANLVNGNAVIDFVGTDNLATATSTEPSITGASTIFVVAKRDAVTDGNFLYDGVATSHGNSVESGAHRISAGTNLDVGAATTAVSIHSTIFSGALTEHYVNGDLQGVAGDAGSNSLGGFTIGADMSSANGLDGQVAEVLVYDGELTDAERHAVESYLSNKWGISVVQQ